MDRQRNRREFLEDVGRGMLVASLGSVAAVEMGLTPALANVEEQPLRFGDLEPLVALMQETPASKIVPTIVAKLKAGTDLREIVAAASLANARTFGGEDYVGFHTLMALAPAYHMARELPNDRQALPVLKVLYRNTNRIGEVGGRAHEVLHRVEPDCCLPDDKSAADALRDQVRGKDMAGAESTFAMLAQGPADEAFNDLLHVVQDNTDVHRVVLPYRAWDLLGIIGKDQAHTLLRQSVRFCVKAERQSSHSETADRPRTLLPALLDQHHLIGRAFGSREADDAWIDRMSRAIFEGTADNAAGAVAEALADGMSPNAIGEAISLAANQLVLRDAGRTGREVQPGKPEGSVHGDSIGVHACDSANAWRNMARVSNARNTAACLILGAYQVAYDRVNRGGDFLHWTPRPRPEDLDPITTKDPAALLRDAEAAIKANDQALACALVHRYGELGHPSRPVFNLLLGYAVSEDGALHGEKYYRTVSEEFAATRPAFRWRQLAALARVTASEYGHPAAGCDEARRLLGV